MKVVTFLKHYGSYNPGERASFDDEVVEALQKSGHVQRETKEPVPQRTLTREAPVKKPSHAPRTK